MFVDFLIERFLEEPRQPAVIAPCGQCSFGELVDEVDRWAGVLSESRVAAGTVVGLEGDFSPSSIALFLALAERGAILVPRRRADPSARPTREQLAEVEVAIAVDADERVRIARSGRTARHELYEKLRARQHPGLVQFSSGSSGEPKAAVHDLKPLLEKFEVRRPALRALSFLLFDHLGGVNTMLHTLSNGATLIAAADRSPETVCRLIEAHRVELLPATPSFLNLLLLSGAHREHDLGSLRVISYGAEPMPDATLARLRRAFPGVKLQQTYGLVEIGVMRTRSRSDDSLWVQVGGEGVETRVVDGALQVRSRSQLLGYLNAEAPITADGWFKTGDLVERNGHYLRFLGRDSDLINVGGEKVYPAEVEGVIESMDGVLEATVYGEPNAIVGQVVCARVRTPAASSADAVEMAGRVKRFCRSRLERFKVPVRVELSGEDDSGDRIKKPRQGKSAAR